MAIQTLKQNSGSAQPVAAGESLKRRALMGSRMTYSRLIGALFLLGFLSYGVGFGLVTSVVGVPDFLATIPAHQTTLVLGAFLMLLNSVVDVGKGVLFFPILEKHGKRTALAYLATMIVEVVLLAVGALSLLMLVPIAQQGVDTGAANVGGPMPWGARGSVERHGLPDRRDGAWTRSIFLCALLFRTRLIPRFLAMWGVIGYAILAAGAIAEIFGIHIGLVLSIPGGLFEVALGFWLLSKGFAPRAYNQES